MPINLVSQEHDLLRDFTAAPHSRGSLAGSHNGTMMATKPRGGGVGAGVDSHPLTPTRSLWAVPIAMLASYKTLGAVVRLVPGTPRWNKHSLRGMSSLEPVWRPEVLDGFGGALGKGQG